MCRPLFFFLWILFWGEHVRASPLGVCTGAHMEARGRYWVSYVSLSLIVRQGDSVNVVLTILGRHDCPVTVLMWASHWAQLCNTRPSCLHSEHFTPRTFSLVFCCCCCCFWKILYLYECLSVHHMGLLPKNKKKRASSPLRLELEVLGIEPESWKSSHCS